MELNEQIPSFLGYNIEGNEVHAEDLPGALIIYFYPKDNTPGCTAEACSLRDGYESLINKGYTVIGISKDSATSHSRFAEKHSLPFMLLSDPDGRVCESFGVWQKKKMAGREYMGIVRTTFVTDANHTVSHIINKVDTKNAAAQLLDVVKDS